VDRSSRSPAGVTVHGGGWSSWVAEREAARARALSDVEEAQRHARAAQREAQAARERQARRDRAGQAHAASGSAPKILLGRQRDAPRTAAGAARRWANSGSRRARPRSTRRGRRWR
jgi:ATPase subunit of ABC transporter with duplicated ATPase domains